MPVEPLESTLDRGAFDLALLRAYKATDDGAAALQRLCDEGWDVGAFLISASPARLIARHGALVHALQKARKVLLAAGPMSLQSFEHVFSLCP